MREKTLVLDMDGTFVDLYGVENWLEDLRAYKTRPYKVAQPLYDMEKLNHTLDRLKANGWHIVVTSWLSMNSNREYDKEVRMAKRDWLARYGVPVDEIHIVKYGTPKADCTRHHGGFQVLVDDSQPVRDSWHLGYSINAKDLDVIKELNKLL